MFKPKIPYINPSHNLFEFPKFETVKTVIVPQQDNIKEEEKQTNGNNKEVKENKEDKLNELEKLIKDKISQYDEALLMIKDKHIAEDQLKEFQTKIENQVNNFQKKIELDLSNNLSNVPNHLSNLPNHLANLPNHLANLPNIQNIQPPIIYQNPPTYTNYNQQPQITDKGKRTKKTYYNINDSMWLDIKNKYPDLIDNYKNQTYSDGTDYYIDIKNKKNLLDNKLILKLLNKK